MFLNTTRRKKIYYVPGLISLIFLPIIFLVVIHLPREFTVLSYAVPKDAKTDENIIQFSGQQIMKDINKKIITTFYLNEDHDLNLKKFDIIAFEALKLKFTYDSTHIIAVHLSDSISYHEFVYLLNIMKKNDQKRYAEWKNIFYIFGEEPPNPKNEIEPIYL